MVRQAQGLPGRGSMTEEHRTVRVRKHQRQQLPRLHNAVPAMAGVPLAEFHDGIGPHRRSNQNKWSRITGVQNSIHRRCRMVSGHRDDGAIRERFETSQAGIERF